MTVPSIQALAAFEQNDPDPLDVSYTFADLKIQLLYSWWTRFACRCAADAQ